MPLLYPGPADTLGASKHHFLVIDIQDGQVHTAADVWVKVTQAAASSAAPNNTSSPNATDHAPRAGSDVADALPQTASCTPQQPQQLVLDQREHSVPGGWLVQAVECQEVLRTTHHSPTEKHYWDAYHAEWRSVTVHPQGVGASAATTVLK